MLYAESALPKLLWVEAINTTVCVTIGNTKIEKKSTFELWFGKVPRWQNFKVFSIVLYVC